MTDAGYEGFEKWGRIAMLVAGALLLALALGLVLAVTPAKATHTLTCEIIDGTRVCTPDEHPNSDPTVSASSGSVSAGEGQTATNTGTYSDAEGNSTVTLSASVGTVTKDAAGDGTWRWSFGTDDGPAQNGTVTITATDDAGATASASFTLTVNNLNPAATFNAPQTSYFDKQFIISMSNPSDPSGADRGAGFTYAFSCGGDFYTSFTGTAHQRCRAGSQPSQTVKAKIRDKDGGVTEYTRTIPVNPAPPSYPNGKVAFASNRDGNGEIYTMNANGTGLARLTNSPASTGDPAFSPDGSKVAFGDGGEIAVVNVNGTGLRDLTSNGGVNYHPTYSPDGSKIAFASNRDGSGEIYVMNADGSGQTRLTNNAAWDAQPAFSPNGSQIAFTSERDGNQEIYVMNADGSGQVNLSKTASHESDPAYSPDGSRILFSCSAVCEMYADGSGRAALTTHGSDPTYSPNGSTIAFTSNQEGNQEIYFLYYEKVGGEQNITVNRAHDYSPSWGGAGDTAPPETIIDSGPSGSVNSTSARFSFSSEQNSIFECRLTKQGQTAGTFTACSSPKDYGNLTEGSYTFEVRATDASGNTDPTPASRTWTVDLTAPTVSGVTPADGAPGIAEGTNVAVTFSETVDAATLNSTTFTLTKQGSTTPVAAAVSYDAATSTATLNPGADLDSRATYTATLKGGSSGAKDKAGNPLATDKTWNFTTADTKVPNVGLTAPADGATVGGIVQLSAEATDNIAVDRVEFLVNGASVGVPDSSSPYERNWDSTSIASDTVRIIAQAYDAAGNGATSAAHTVTVDNVAPETSLDSGPSGTVTSTSASFSFSSPEAGATFECKLDGEAFSACSSPKEYTGLSDGSHAFSVRARDAAGNVDASPVSTQWSIDTTAPTVTAVTPADDATGVAVSDNVTAAFSEAMNINTIYESTFTLFRQGSNTPVSANVDYDREIRKATLDPVVDLEADALYTATVEGGSSGAKDSAGNPLAGDRVWSFRTAAPPDTTAPAAPTITDGPAEGSTSTSRSATFTFGSEEGATFLCSMDGAAFSGCTPGVGFTGLTDGPHRFEVKARDAAGNESGPAVRLWSVDATAPTIKNWTPKGTGIKPTARPTVVFSEKMDEASVEAKDAGGLPTTFFLKKGISTVAATVSYVEAETATGARVYKAVLVPNKRLRSGAKYTATVTTAATDAAGNPSEVTKTWRFTVG